MKNEYKMIQLIEKLKARNNGAHVFFENLLIELKRQDQHHEAIRKLSSSYAIVQYANFTAEEEQLLSDIIEENLTHD
jgi:hypothetical protein